jgi:hypothetical protein
MSNILRLLFIFNFLIIIAGILLFINYRHQHRTQRELIRQERKVVTRLNYLERLGRNDFGNYTNLLQHNINKAIVKDSLFQQEFDSITRANTAYIADFWMLIKSGEETADLDSLIGYRKKYLAAVNSSISDSVNSHSLISSQLSDNFKLYRNYHQQLMNQQYAQVSKLLRRSHEKLVNETASIVILMLCCMTMAMLLSWYTYWQYRKLKQ